MQAVGQKDTGPEMAIRRPLHALGYRYILHAKGLLGRPDLVFPARRKVIFVHGCFWHGHECPKGRAPKSRQEYWRPKIEANRQRDFRVVEQLASEGWASYTVWECETKNIAKIIEEVVNFLGPVRHIDSRPDQYAVTQECDQSESTFSAGPEA